MKADAFHTLADVPRETARLHGGKAALIFEDVATSFADMDRQSDDIAARLGASGVQPGDRVALLARNSAAYVVLLFGIAKAGAVATPLNWRLSAAELGGIAQDAEISLLILDPALAHLAPELTVPRMSVQDAFLPPGPDRPLTFTAGGQGDLAALIYTSGTTGRPKGVMLTHGNFARHCGLDAPPTPDYAGFTPNDVALSVLPLFHVGGIEFTFRPLFTGATVIMHQDFSVPRILRDIPLYRVTIMGLVSPALNMMLRHPDCPATDFSSLRRFIYGASPIAIDLLKQGVATLQCGFVQSYGLTESSGTCAMLAPADHDDPEGPRMKAAGRPIHGSQIRIAGQDGLDAPIGVVGEILVRGSGVMQGYWRQPEATAAAFTPDGWLRSGDAGCLDADGYLYVSDRVKDMIISGGENIYPAEVESAIFGHPAVAEVAVIGVPDPTWGEAVKAVIVPKPGMELDTNELIAWTKTRIASFKAPKSVDLVGELPKSATGKVLRRTIREPFWHASNRPAG